MDEYIGIDPEHPASFPRFLRERFLGGLEGVRFEPISSDPDRVEEICSEYDALLREHPKSVNEEGLTKAKAFNAQRYYYQGIGRYAPDAAMARGLADLAALATLIPAGGFVHGPAPTAVDAGIYGFIANIYFYDIDTPLKQFVVAHDNIVQHCKSIHARVA